MTTMAEATPNTATAGPAPEPPNPRYDVATIMGGLYGDGIIALKGAFSREWVEQLRADVDAAFEEALTRPGGAVGRGPKR